MSDPCRDSGLHRFATGDQVNAAKPRSLCRTGMGTPTSWTNVQPAGTRSRCGDESRASPGSGSHPAGSITLGFGAHQRANSFSARKEARDQSTTDVAWADERGTDDRQFCIIRAVQRALPLLEDPWSLARGL